ncbi:MAG: hypothetical protein JSY10_28615 [Paenibacillus sp.]|nr:hypothetical protein [Paenibacillus sp.]
MTSIKDLLQKGKQRSSEDTQLRLALELSKQEHIKEQQRLLRQFSKPIQRKRRIIQKEEEEEEEEEDEEEEDWFQTISSRPQHKNQAKRETVNRAKREILKQEEPFEFDLSSIFEEQPQQQQEQQEEDNEFFKDNADNVNK